jgi:hypothetical protein
LFAVLSILGRQSFFYIGSSGSGKSRLLEGVIRAFTGSDLMIHNWNSMSMYELITALGKVSGRELLWTVEEWSMLEDYHRESILKVASKLITDGKFERKYSMPKEGVVDVSITNCTLTMAINIQPYKFKRLMHGSESWNSLSADRFTKFPLINAIKGPTVNFAPMVIVPVMYQTPQQIAHPLLTRMFREHFTGTRSELASANYATASCKLNNTQQFTEQDAITFQSLFWPYLSAWPTFIHSTDPEREESFYTGPFRILESFMEYFPQPLSIRELQSIFHMINPGDSGSSYNTIHRYLDVLIDRQLIGHANPEFGKFELSPAMKDYFNTYRRLWN